MLMQVKNPQLRKAYFACDPLALGVFIFYPMVREGEWFKGPTFGPVSEVWSTHWRDVHLSLIYPADEDSRAFKMAYAARDALKAAA
jgi:hypothetical protein